MYCKKCGAKLKENVHFCSNCTTSASQESRENHYAKVSYSQNRSSTKKKSFNKLCCELAYTGTLFWMPLLSRSKENITWYCANQGLWMLILSAVACWILRMVGWIRSLFTGSIGSAFAGQIYAFVFMIFIIFMAYLAFSGFKSAMAIHRGEHPQPILFFDQYAIIKERGEVL